ncbi:hypothetical protein LP420_41015 [Massilia sp. B-10]|nr:hypothetical protein LP420_41015 [Massilia sp. B-10]
MLENDGHTVVAADGGQAGIDQFHAAQLRGQPFALVITDLGMPYVDGRRVASAVKAMAPSHAGDPADRLGPAHRLRRRRVRADVDRVLSKPPKLLELREALAACVPDRENV